MTKKAIISEMKKITAYIINAQNKFNLSEVKSLVNYGIDYTMAKVYGRKETGYQSIGKIPFIKL